MKKIMHIVAIGLMTTAAAVALAQTPAVGPGPGFGAGPCAVGDPSVPVDRRLQRMTARLGLTQEQQAQVRTILEEQQAKGAALRGETHARVGEVLNEQQRAQADQWFAQRSQARPTGWGGPGCRQGMGRGPGMGYGRGMGYGPRMGYGPCMGYTAPPAAN